VKQGGMRPDIYSISGWGWSSLCCGGKLFWRVCCDKRGRIVWSEWTCDLRAFVSGAL